MNYDKQIVIDGLKRTIEQNEEKIIEYSKPLSHAMAYVSTKIDRLKEIEKRKLDSKVVEL
ncbi:hypothetical protein MissC_0031 [Streptococcus phage MissC]|nr:hypothetical protein MissC_0031 [Streptococcus phage MissC]